MSTPTLIVFTAFKRTGKSTAAKYLEEKYGFTRINFKDALVNEIKQNFPDLLEEILKQEYSDFLGIKTIDDLFEVKTPLIRTLLQNYGTDVRRKDNPNYWTIQWEQSLHQPLKENKAIVTDDCRFLNEAEAVRALGGIIIRLTRPDITSGGTHASETEMEQIEADYTIECEVGNPEKLYTALDEILLNHNQK